MDNLNIGAYPEYTTESLYQWDKNQVLNFNIDTLTVPPVVHFADIESDKAIVVQSTGSNGVFSAVIPNELLQKGEDISVYIYVIDALVGNTIKKITIPVIPRKEPDDYIFTQNVEITTLAELESVINNCVSLVEDCNEELETKLDNLPFTNIASGSMLEIKDCVDYPLVNLKITPESNSISTVDITLCGENLFDGEIELGSIDLTTGSPSVDNSRVRSKNFIAVNPDTNYTFIRNKKGGNRWVVGYDENKNPITDGTVSETYHDVLRTIGPATVVPDTFKFKTSVSTRFIKWYDTASTDTSENVTISSGNPIEYVPYEEQTATINIASQSGWEKLHTYDGMTNIISSVKANLEVEYACTSFGDLKLDKLYKRGTPDSEKLLEERVSENENDIDDLTTKYNTVNTKVNNAKLLTSAEYQALATKDWVNSNAVTADNIAISGSTIELYQSLGMTTGATINNLFKFVGDLLELLNVNYIVEQGTKTVNGIVWQYTKFSNGECEMTCGANVSWSEGTLQSSVGVYRGTALLNLPISLTKLYFASCDANNSGLWYGVKLGTYEPTYPMTQLAVYRESFKTFVAGSSGFCTVIVKGKYK